MSKYLRGNREGPAPREYLDYKLMTELWKVPPTVLDEQPEDVIDLHIRIYGEELRAQKIQREREAQKQR